MTYNKYITWRYPKYRFQVRHLTRKATQPDLLHATVLRTGSQTPDGWIGFPCPLAAPTAWTAREREADRLAVPAIAEAGYDPTGLASYLKKFSSAGPRPDERVSTIETEIRALPPRTYVASGEFERVQAEIRRE